MLETKRIVGWGGGVGGVVVVLLLSFDVYFQVWPPFCGCVSSRFFHLCDAIMNDCTSMRTGQQ